MMLLIKPKVMMIQFPKPLQTPVVILSIFQFALRNMDSMKNLIVGEL